MVLVNEAERTELGWDIAGQVATPGLRRWRPGAGAVAGLQLLQALSTTALQWTR
jgi:hypothetical protein